MLIMHWSILNFLGSPINAISWHLSLTTSAMRQIKKWSERTIFSTSRCIKDFQHTITSQLYLKKVLLVNSFGWLKEYIKNEMFIFLQTMSQLSSDISKHFSRIQTVCFFEASLSMKWFNGNNCLYHHRKLSKCAHFVFACTDAGRSEVYHTTGVSKDWMDLTWLLFSLEKIQMAFGLLQGSRIYKYHQTVQNRRIKQQSCHSGQKTAVRNTWFSLAGMWEGDEMSNRFEAETSLSLLQKRYWSLFTYHVAPKDNTQDVARLSFWVDF